MRIKAITLSCILVGIFALVNGKSITKAGDGLKNRKTKDEVDNEQSNTLIQRKNESLSSKQESEEEQKAKDPCVCNGSTKEERQKDAREACGYLCQENKKCQRPGKKSKCKNHPDRCQCQVNDDTQKETRPIQSSDKQRQCDCKCKGGAGRKSTRQTIPKPVIATAGSVNPIQAIAAQHGIGKKTNSGKKCCCDCGHDCCDCCHDCCDCCHDCCCNDCCHGCCHDCCHDCCCHCCEPCCGCCCHCCEPCCCCCHCCEPCCCHCCHCCHHCPCCCGCCKKSKSLLNSQALATAAALAANSPVHH
ncbi:PREDICTED: keratin-associated protein 10-4-like [Acropora digitifera]|uniref:keratin-associated protein 10-4-like n=1 Tax=Acropora digitifera TaxID=70779 RepID=UPI00077AFC49|nr:PREDICTED: keratin-associated protein 10-4-like [Acropora digitifera]